MVAKEFRNRYSIVFDTCIEVANEIGFRVEETGLIKANTDASIISWGETVNIQVRELSGDITKVIIHSELQAQLIGWWKNEQNEHNFMRILSVKLVGA